jgi:hypothetical protein
MLNGANIQAKASGAAEDVLAHAAAISTPPYNETAVTFEHATVVVLVVVLVVVVVVGGIVVVDVVVEVVVVVVDPVSQ